MSYEKQTWQTGDVVTSAKLNHMEDGIAAGGGALVVNVADVDEVRTCDKTAGEIYAACPAVIFVSGTTEYMSVLPLASYGFGDSGYTFGDMLDTEYTAATANDYPTSSEGPK